MKGFTSIRALKAAVNRIDSKTPKGTVSMHVRRLRKHIKELEAAIAARKKLLALLRRR